MVVSPMGCISTTSYDTAGGRAEINGPGETTSYGYDLADHRIRVVDGEGNITTTLYDALGRPTVRIDAEGVTTSVYDAAAAHALTNARGYTTDFDYDARGRLTSQTDPLGNTITFAYDAVGNRIRRINARGQCVSYSYNAVGELTGEAYPGGSSHSYDYDLAGNRTSLADATGTTSFVYDSRNLLRSVTDPDGKTVSYSYDAVRRRATMTDPDGGITSYGYDAADRLTSITNPQGKLTSLAYDLAGRKISVQQGNGAVTSYTYDCADRLRQIENRASDGSLVNLFTYSYDDAGNRTQADESNGDVTVWDYDHTYQLTHEQRTGSVSFNVTYTYDAAGNRTVQVDSGAVTTYSYDAANRLLTEENASGITTYSYDDDGNRTQKETDSETTYYTWDDDSRLTVAEPTAGAVTFSYRADGKRVKKESVSDTTKFIYDFNRLLQETDDSDTVQEQYTSTLAEWGELVSEYDGSDTFYHQYDGIGSTDALLDADPTPTDRYKHRAFGLEAAHSGTADTPFTFVGQQNYYRDPELELYFAGARYYDPAAGRWLSADPIGFAAGDENLFRYVGNNPVNAVDPSGEVSSTLVGARIVQKWRNGGISDQGFVRQYVSIRDPRIRLAIRNELHLYGKEDRIRRLLLRLERGPSPTARRDERATEAAPPVSPPAPPPPAPRIAQQPAPGAPAGASPAETTPNGVGQAVIHGLAEALAASRAARSAIQEAIESLEKEAQSPPEQLARPATYDDFFAQFWEQHGGTRRNLLRKAGQGEEAFGTFVQEHRRLEHEARQYALEQLEKQRAMLKAADAKEQERQDQLRSAIRGLQTVEGFLEYIDALGEKLIAKHGHAFQHQDLTGEIRVGEIETAAREELAERIDPTSDIRFAWEAGKEVVANPGSTRAWAIFGVAVASIFSSWDIIRARLRPDDAGAGGAGSSSARRRGSAGPDADAGVPLRGVAAVRKTLTASDVTPGMEINPAEVNVFRGGDSLQARPTDVKIEKATGLLKTTHGLSLNVSAEAMSRFGGAFRIESIPPELRIIQRGKELTHFEIVPREPMTPQRFQELLDQIKISPAS